MKKTASKTHCTEQIIRKKIEEDLNNGNGLYRFLFKIAYSITYDYHEAEDATQNALIKLWENTSYYSYPINREIQLLEDNNMRNWIYTIGKNSAIETAKKRWKFRKKHILYSDYVQNEETFSLDELIFSNENPGFLVTESENKKIIIKTLKEMILELPEKFREPIKMHYNDKKKYREIAEELNIPINSVKKSIFSAKQILRKKLKEGSLFTTYN